MKDIYTKVKELNAKDPATHVERLGKLAEEVGEIATEVNKLTGRKAWKEEDSNELIAIEILHEGADIIQNVFSLLEGFGFEYEDIIKALKDKNTVWEKVLEIKKNKNMLELVYAKNILFAGSKVIKDKGEFVIVFYWQREFPEMYEFPPMASGCVIRHIVKSK